MFRLKWEDWRFLSSLRMAVLVIIALAVVSAVGTIYEARFDAEVAQKLVYQSIYMYIVLGALCINLIAVMVDRWPWKRHHSGFVLAHIGILTLLFGAWLTQRFGVDGTMAFEIGQQQKSVTIRERSLAIYSSLDGDSFREIYRSDIDLLRHPPSETRPLVIHVGSDPLEIYRYEHFAFRDTTIEATSNELDGPAIRFQLENANVNMTQWLRRENRREINEIDLGPAIVSLAKDLRPPRSRNEVLFIPQGKGSDLKYVIYNKDGTLRKTGIVKESGTIETGWMGLKVRLLRSLPHAREVVSFQKAQSASPLASSAIWLRFRGEDYSLGLNSVLKIYLSDRMYFITYGFKQLDLQFPLQLKEFRIGNYQGTDRAASYESVVDVPTIGQRLISMNEPLKFQGFTFYQSSFEKNDRGQPVASILSVNYDPGRWVKYLGSLMIVLGSLVLFYFKRSVLFGGARRPQGQSPS